MSTKPCGVGAFLQQYLENPQYTHLLEWVDQGRGHFRILWLHAGRANFDKEYHQALFYAYRTYKGLPIGDDAKQSFGMALKKSPAVQALKNHPEDDWRYYVFNPDARCITRHCCTPGFQIPPFSPPPTPSNLHHTYGDIQQNENETKPMLLETVIKSEFDPANSPWHSYDPYTSPPHTPGVPVLSPTGPPTPHTPAALYPHPHTPGVLSPTGPPPHTPTTIYPHPHTPGVPVLSPTGPPTPHTPSALYPHPHTSSTFSAPSQTPNSFTPAQHTVASASTTQMPTISRTHFSYPIPTTQPFQNVPVGNSVPDSMANASGNILGVSQNTNGIAPSLSMIPSSVDAYNAAGRRVDNTNGHIPEDLVHLQVGQGGALWPFPNVSPDTHPPDNHITGPQNTADRQRPQVFTFPPCQYTLGSSQQLYGSPHAINSYEHGPSNDQKLTKDPSESLGMPLGWNSLPDPSESLGMSPGLNSLPAGDINNNLQNYQNFENNFQIPQDSEVLAVVQWET